MAAPPRNLVNLQSVGKGYQSRTILSNLSLGVGAGERIGIVGRNGDGKSTLMRLIAGIEEPDSGQVTHTAGLHLDLVAQDNRLDPTQTIRAELVGDRPDHEWAGDPRVRSILDGLLGGVELQRFPDGLETVIAPLSGGEQRRIALAKALLDTQDLLLLDEPTNHLDIEAVDWLARHLKQRNGALVVITHDRWFLDEVVEQTWEVVNESVHQYEGGYAAYVLARAERDRQESTLNAKRRQLVRKELAWLRRGPPARTSKPKFRIDAANELIADEPPVRDSVELVRFATTRLGNKVLAAIDISKSYGSKLLLHETTWRLGPGDRIALVGANGTGKSTLINILAGATAPDRGHVEQGSTVRLAVLSQDTAEVPGHLRVMQALEEVRQTATTGDGAQVSAGKLCERFGFRGPKSYTLVKDLSGGERRRLQLMRLLMEEPNVLILDEPTNDLDIDTLTALEDLLDSWPGTLVVVSHDRYFVERVTDNVYGIDSSGSITHLPGGIDQYVEQRRALSEQAAPARPTKPGAPKVSNNDLRAAKKDLARTERSIEKLDAREKELSQAMEEAAMDHEKLHGLQLELDALKGERHDLEGAWLELSGLLET
jgi:ATP-binding cassette subfamily F protein uup